MHRTRGYAPLIAVVVIAVAWSSAWLLSSSSLPKPNGQYHLTAVVPSAEFLGEKASVTIAGLKVGRVTSVSRRDGAARVTLALDPKYGPLPRDSRFAVRLRSVVGENYVELTPGRSPSMLPDHGVLAIDQAERYVNVDEILTTLKGQTRVRAREALGGLADGLGGHGSDANRTIGGAAATVEDGAPVTRLLAEQDDQIARLTDDLGVVTRTLGDRGNQIRALSRSGRTTAEVIASRDDAVRSIIDRLPHTLTSVRRATATLATVSGRATPTLRNTGRLLNDLRPAADRLAPAARAGTALVTELDRAATPVTGVVDRLAAAAPVLATAFPKLRSVMCELNPVAEYLRPYAVELGSVLQNMGYANNSYDATGHSARLHLALGMNELKTYDTQTASDIRALAKLGVVSLLNTAYNPFPEPGKSAETAQPGDPAGFAEVKKTYPRIKAEC